MGYVDTQRTSSSPRWVSIYSGFTAVAFAGFLWQAADFILAAVFAWPWSWLAAVPSAVCAALLTALCIEAESTPFTAGANDNASGAGMVLSLARHLAREPLEHTRVRA